MSFGDFDGLALKPVLGHRVSAPGRGQLVNLQVERGQAKRYQVRQVMGLVRRYNLSLEEER